MGNRTVGQEPFHIVLGIAAKFPIVSLTTATTASIGTHKERKEANGPRISRISKATKRLSKPRQVRRDRRRRAFIRIRRPHVKRHGGNLEQQACTRGTPPPANSIGSRGLRAAAAPQCPAKRRSRNPEQQRKSIGQQCARKRAKQQKFNRGLRRPPVTPDRTPPGYRTTAPSVPAQEQHHQIRTCRQKEHPALRKQQQREILANRYFPRRQKPQCRSRYENPIEEKRKPIRSQRAMKPTQPYCRKCSCSVAAEAAPTRKTKPSAEHTRQQAAIANKMLPQTAPASIPATRQMIGCRVKRHFPNVPFKRITISATGRSSRSKNGFGYTPIQMPPAPLAAAHQHLAPIQIRLSPDLGLPHLTQHRPLI